jgi:hypothetical protein
MYIYHITLLKLIKESFDNDACLSRNGDHGYVMFFDVDVEPSEFNLSQKMRFNLYCDKNCENYRLCSDDSEHDFPSSLWQMNGLEEAIEAIRCASLPVASFWSDEEIEHN